MRVTSKIFLCLLLATGSQAVIAGTVCLKNRDGVGESWQTSEKDVPVFKSTEACTEQVPTALGKKRQTASEKTTPLTVAALSQVQLWETSPADINMRLLIQKWAGSAGWTALWKVERDIPLESADQVTGDFKVAVRRLLSATALSDLAIKPCFHTNNVVRVVRETTKCNPNE